MKMLTLVATVLVFPAVAVAQTRSCAELASLQVPYTHIESAQQRADYCEVKGIVSPVPDSRIGFTVWLPSAERWSQRLHMVGNGGYSSKMYVDQLEARIKRGDVAVATDTGHTGSDLTFGRDHPEAIVDWGNRAVHESVTAAKAVVRAYYGRPQKYAYFSGSSTGGHQALMVAQRHPEDFNGIIAGAPGNNRSNLNLLFLWSFLHNHRHGDNQHQIVPNRKLAMVHAAVVKACDAVDRVEDGVIDDPRECHFDLQSLKCPGAETNQCLTDEQIGALQAIYRGPRDARTGRQIFAGFPFGSEGIPYGDDEHPGWAEFWADPRDPTRPQRSDFFRYWVFHDPHWDWWKFNWGSDVDTVNRVIAPVVNATDPDLSRFRSRGGKLIMFIGWNDPVGSAFDAIEYYDNVVARGAGADSTAKLADTQQFARLYVVPGMSHTAGGPGATHFSNATRDSAPPVEDSRHDMGLALYDWVERGIAPEELIGTHFSEGSGPTGKVQFQRPLCVYPQVSRYRGGDRNSAASFHCISPGSHAGEHTK
jgi:feruloyl esterase